ncbi:MAG: Alanine dehydrogenase [Deltaproteobacteria bacterium ADurb.Bin510]|nr:MAG: Alanine dehydrogenase [Deltaproteobacteria bacterium ADurb.Bin510]
MLIPGTAAPKLISDAMVKSMQPGSVIVDVAVDQGGCCVNTRPTYHDQPTFVVDEVIHYCVANMPGAVPLTSTLGLAGATLPYALRLAGQGLKACASDAALGRGVNTHRGALCHRGVAESLGLAWTELAAGTL